MVLYACWGGGTVQEQNGGARGFLIQEFVHTDPRHREGQGKPCFWSFNHPLCSHPLPPSLHTRVVRRSVWPLFSNMLGWWLVLSIPCKTLLRSGKPLHVAPPSQHCWGVGSILVNDHGMRRWHGCNRCFVLIATSLLGSTSLLVLVCLFVLCFRGDVSGVDADTTPRCLVATRSNFYVFYFFIWLHFTCLSCVFEPTEVPLPSAHTAWLGLRNPSRGSRRESLVDSCALAGFFFVCARVFLSIVLPGFGICFL